MKIACISDIHGNKEALDKVLSDIEYINADTIFCLGDLAMGGYDPNYTIEKILNIKNALIIQGNTDKLIYDYSDNIFNKLNEINPLMASALKLDVKEIKSENKDKLKNLPVNRVFEKYGVKFFLCHGSPRRQDENLYPDTPINIVEDSISSTDADIILCGHTHIPCGFSLNSAKTVVNVGSVGRSMTDNKTPVYLLITIKPDGTYTFEHRYVKYDNKKVADIIKNRNFEFSNEFSKLYIGDKWI